MLRAMVALKSSPGGKGKLYVAHLNHGLRAAAADEDQRWLQLLCEQLGIQLEVGRADVAPIAEQQGDGWEAAARAARYDFLRHMAEHLGARFVATGHTADDQAETVLHRLLRGTGIEGIGGIPRVRRLSASVALVRPMLNVRRADVLEYLSSIGQDYRIDATNQDNQWTRNRLRNELLPELREIYNPQVDAALTRLATQANEAHDLISAIAEKVARDCVVVTATGTQIDCKTLAEQPPIIVREVFKLAWREAGWPLQSMGFDEWQQLASLASGGNSRVVINLPGNIRARFQSGRIILDSPGG
jgi:tRNA(Ile)-lysidine synthase